MLFVVPSRISMIFFWASMFRTWGGLHQYMTRYGEDLDNQQESFWPNNRMYTGEPNQYYPSAQYGFTQYAVRADAESSARQLSFEMTALEISRGVMIPSAYTYEYSTARCPEPPQAKSSALMISVSYKWVL